MDTMIKSYWEDIKDKIKLEYPVVTDDDLYFSEGKEYVMMDRLSYKLGITREELQMIIGKL
jgi:hypothetical protein